MRRSLRGVLVLAALAGPVFAAAAPASADATYEQALWYYTDFNMAANLATANGSGVTIAVIDGSIDTSVPELAGAKIAVQPSQCLLNGSSNPVVSSADATHGTNIAVMLAGNGTGNWNGRGGKGVAPGASILYYRNSTDRTDGQGTECKSATGDDVFDTATANAIDDAVAKGARVITMSFGANGSLSETSTAIGAAERKGVVVLAATDDQDTPNSPDRVPPPAKYNGVVVVNASTTDSTAAPKSSASSLVTFASPGEGVCVGGFNPSTGKWDSSGVANGSSYATPWTAGVIADAMSRFPQATGNQILQLMIRTTGGTVHEPLARTTNGFGFGTPSLTTMLENDAMTMPDQNPLLRDDAVPSTAEILGQSTAPSSNAPSSATTPPPSSTAPSQQASAEKDDSSSLPLVIGIVIAVLVVIGIVVLVLVLRSRRRPPSGGPPSGTGSAAPPPPTSGVPAR